MSGPAAHLIQSTEWTPCLLLHPLPSQTHPPKHQSFFLHTEDLSPPGLPSKFPQRPLVSLAITPINVLGFSTASGRILTWRDLHQTQRWRLTAPPHSLRRTRSAPILGPPRSCGCNQNLPMGRRQHQLHPVRPQVPRHSLPDWRHMRRNCGRTQGPHPARPRVARPSPTDGRHMRRSCGLNRRPRPASTTTSMKTISKKIPQSQLNRWDLCFITTWN